MDEKLWSCYFARANVMRIEKMIKDTEKEIEVLVEEKNTKMNEICSGSPSQRSNIVSSSAKSGSFGHTHLSKIQGINSKRVSIAKLKTVMNGIIKKVESSTSENYRDLCSKLENVERLNFGVLTELSTDKSSILSSLPLDLVCVIRNFSTGCETKPVREESSFLVTDALRSHAYCEQAVSETR